MSTHSDSASLILTSATSGMVKLKQIVDCSVDDDNESEVVVTTEGPQGTMQKRGGWSMSLTSKRKKTKTPEVNWQRLRETQEEVVIVEDYPGAQRYQYRGVVSKVGREFDNEGKVEQKIELVLYENNQTR